MSQNFDLNQNYYLFNDKKTIPIVFIHGVGLDNQMWQPQINALNNFSTLSYDLLVNPAQAIKLDFFLNPIYKIKFKTEEKGLVFELNGEHRWDVPYVRLELEAGDHSLRVFKIGEIIDEQIIRVDEPKRFNYYLKKPLTSN